MQKFMTALLLLISSELYGADLFFKYSINAIPPYQQVKGLMAGVQTKPDVFAFKYEAGLLHDQRTSEWSALGLIGIGIEPTYGPLYLHFFQSVGAVSKEDAYLSGYFQFFEEVGIGFRGKEGTGVGIGYKHISNAGLSSPNLGKDLISIQVRMPI